MVAALLGTGPLAFFVLCNQLTQPIPALLAAGFNFTFPNFSARSASGQIRECRDSYRTAMLVSAVVVTAIGLPMILLARQILTLWLGPTIATKCEGLLVLMIIGNGLLALSVVPQYTALALGKARALVWINLAAGVVSLTGGYLLIRHIGLLGGGFVRLLAGVVSLFALTTVRGVFTLPVETRQSLQSELTAVAGFDPVSS
jgi:O-antigen/teichoic acid export membrane protein